MVEAASDTKKKGIKSFPRLFWLVVLMEFFERGSYYGMMSVLSVYMTDVLRFAKEDVGLIKGTIQPLLYFLPILSGALADRFGYRRALMVAFSLLGTGYFLTSQATGYAAVFISLVVMGIGAGTFKPIISGTIARTTDESNSTLGFGIFYWSINLGAFLFPLFLVPYLKNNVGWDWVILASAIGTGAMLIPTLLWFREPPRADSGERDKSSLLQTLANAFEIIYSPLILLWHAARGGLGGAALRWLIVLGTLGAGVALYMERPVVSDTRRALMVELSGQTTRLLIERNLCKAAVLSAKAGEDGAPARVIVFRPDDLRARWDEARAALKDGAAIEGVSADLLAGLVTEASRRATLELTYDPALSAAYELSQPDPARLAFRLTVQSPGAWRAERAAIGAALSTRDPHLAAIPAASLDELAEKGEARGFLVLFVGLLMLASQVLLALSPWFRGAPQGTRLAAIAGTVALFGVLLWVLPGLSLFARILTTVLSATLLSLFAIDSQDREAFGDHARFLLMIFLYSGFWILYFQMFDSVLWYVQAYVDASALDGPVNVFLGWFGGSGGWRFDVEHVTVVNAGTIILLQLVVSKLVENTRALPTMVAGILIATSGMAILAISTDIWFFLVGIIIFSIGEMTAHPKFISYVGQTAPKARVAMYMGYLFLYGVIGSSIGGVVGAKLYVRFVDELGQPRTLWLIFTGIGVATVVGLLLYDGMMKRRSRLA
jgi:dipeptide/tripeptide permease